MDGPLILASRSPRRRALLKKVRLDVVVVPSAVSENFRDGESPRDHVLRLAKEKTERVAQRYPDRWVIGADTVVVVGRELLGKPEDACEAARMLFRLSGRDHRVFTGFAIARQSRSVLVPEVVETKVKIKDLSPEEVDWYVSTGEPFGKAGGYAIQGAGCFMVEAIEGSYTNVVGLPVCEVLTVLRSLGAIDLRRSMDPRDCSMDHQGECG